MLDKYEEDYEARKLYKKNLQEDYLNRMRERAQAQQQPPTPTKKVVHSKSKKQKDTRSFETQIEQLKKELQLARKQNRDDKQEISSLKAKNYRLHESNKQQQDLINTLENTSANQQNQLKQITEAEKSSDKINAKGRMAKTLREQERLAIRVQKLANDKLSLQKNVRSLKKQLETMSILQKDQGIQQQLQLLKETLKNVSLELRTTKDRLAWVESTPQETNIAQAITYLLQNIDYASIESNPRIVSMARHILQMYDNLVTKQRYKQKAAEQKKYTLKSQVEDMQFGYVSQIEEQYMFTSIENNQVYPLAEQQIRFEEGMPVKVIVKDGQADILNVYNTQSRPLKAKRRYKSTKTPTKTKSTTYIGDLNVLVIGLRNKNTYINALQNAGVQAVWHDPIEESYERLRSKYGRADLVLVCTGHIPHAVMYTLESINPEDPKVDHMYHDNETKILARIRFMALNLGLIKSDQSA